MTPRLFKNGRKTYDVAVGKALHAAFWLVVALLFLYTVQLGRMVWSAAALRGPSLTEAAKAAGLPYDQRPAEAVAAELRARGEDASLHFSPSFLSETDGVALPSGRIFPLGGMSRKLVVHCNEFGRWESYRSDEHGFRNPPGLYKAPLDAVLIGDSFAEGACVPDGQDLAARLRTRWPRTLTFGMGGAGPLIELGVLEEYAARLKPARVFWLYYASDMSDLASERRSATLEGYRAGRTQRLFERGREADAAWKAFEAQARERGVRPFAGGQEPVGRLEKARRFVCLYYLRAWARGAYPLTTGEKERLDEYLGLLSLARERTASWGGRFTFVYLPERAAFLDPLKADRYRLPLLRGARALGIDVVDGAEVFKAAGDPLSNFWLRASTHYDAPGYEKLAQSLQR